MTTSASLRFKINSVFSLLLFTGLVFSMGTSVYAQSQKELNKLTEKINREESKLKQLEAKLEAKKQRVKAAHAKLFDFKTQKALGEAVHKAFQSKPGSAEALTDLVASDLRKEFGREIFASVRSTLVDIWGAMLDDKVERGPDDYSRSLNECFKGNFDKENFEHDWEKVIAKESIEFKNVVKAQAVIRKLGQERDAKQSALLSDLTAQIPPRMVPVPEAKNAAIGLRPTDISEISEICGDETDKNRYLAFSTTNHTVDVKAFMIDQYEVTQKAYWYFCQQTGHREPQFYERDNPLFGKVKGEPREIWRSIWVDGKILPGQENLPVDCVSLDDIMAYARWVGKRIPLEIEWEVASRSNKNGFDGRYFPWGNNKSEDIVNCDSELDHPKRQDMVKCYPKGFKPKGLVPVGTFDSGRSPLGIYDLGGNVSERTVSEFRPWPGFQAIKDATSSHFKEGLVVARGGNCEQRFALTGAIFRHGVPATGRYPLIGFRCVRSGMAGKDQLEDLTRNNALSSRLLDFHVTRDEEKAKQIHPLLEDREGYFAIKEKLSWNEELDVPGKAEHILVVNRKFSAGKLNSLPNLNKLGKGKKNELKDSFLLGVVRLPIASIDPVLPAGTYFVSYKYAWKEKPPKGKVIKHKSKFLFVPHKIDGVIQRREAKGAVVESPKDQKPGTYKTEMTIVKTPDGDKLLIVFAYDRDKAGRKKTLIEVPFLFAKDALNGYK